MSVNVWFHDGVSSSPCSTQIYCHFYILLFLFAGREAATETGDVKLPEGSPKEVVETGSRCVMRRDEGN